MEKFISKIARRLYQNKKDQLEQLIVVMPSKRAGTFFKKALAENSDSPLWMPKIYAIEEWLEELSGLSILGKTHLIFEMYISYQNVFPKEEQDSFEDFLRWGPTLLKDFNDIDAYSNKPEEVFNYIHQAKKIESWSPSGGGPSSLVQNYLRFWELMGLLFVDFKARLKNQNTAFQGMAYREAHNQITNWISKNKPEKESIYYLGFNAMNPCETHIMKTLMTECSAQVFWDVDDYYLNDKKQEAGKYLRQYQKWPVYDNRAFNWVGAELKKEKKIRVYGVPKAIAQAQLTGSILNNLYSRGQKVNDVAVVLADEKLLSPVLEFLPDSVKEVNVTMGNALKNVHLYAFFDGVFQLHLNHQRLENESSGFYYKDLFKVWQQPAFQSSETAVGLLKIKHELHSQNKSFISKDSLFSLCDANTYNWLEALLGFDSTKPTSVIDGLLCLITLIKNAAVKEKNTLLLEELFAFTTLFNQIKTLQKKFGCIEELKTLYKLFQQSSKTETMSYYGEPLSGLQLMGMLETRNLDFNEVVLLSVNEGFLPSGKTENTFVPFDIRKELGLPTYEDADAVFAYHFYRLAQRCKKLTLIYNTESDALGSGEKSRFISQIENELVTSFPNEIDFKEEILSHELQKVEPKEFTIEKDEFVMKRLKEIATGKGFSPSSLNTYKNCPLQFYYEKILNIKATEEVEETIEASTLGTVIHKALEAFYLPFLGRKLLSKDVKAMLPEVPTKLTLLFKAELNNDSFVRGKNKLIYTVAEQFLSAFLKQEIAFLDSGKSVEIIGLEKDLTSEITIDDIDFPIKLTGNADRVDVVNKQIRIIDYKTGKVELKDVQADQIQKIIREEQHQKGFQLFMYAYMYKEMYEAHSLEAGIISFRALKKGFLSAGIKEGKNSFTLFDKTLLNPFEEELKLLLKELFDPSIPFTHSGRKSPCRFCDPEKFIP